MLLKTRLVLKPNICAKDVNHFRYAFHSIVNDRTPSLYDEGGGGGGGGVY